MCISRTLPKSPIASRTSRRWRSDLARSSMLARDIINSLGTTRRGSLLLPPCSCDRAITVDPLFSKPGKGPIFTPLNLTPWKVAHVGKASMGCFSHPSCRPLLIIVERAFTGLDGIVPRGVIYRRRDTTMATSRGVRAAAVAPNSCCDVGTSACSRIDFVRCDGFVGPCDFMHACRACTDFTMPSRLCYWGYLAETR